jgi:hypothetical protein
MRRFVADYSPGDPVQYQYGRGEQKIAPPSGAILKNGTTGERVQDADPEGTL